ncbi:26467_t:CDS:2, partial [Racocetra persica]
IEFNFKFIGNPPPPPSVVGEFVVDVGAVVEARGVGIPTPPIAVDADGYCGDRDGLDTISEDSGHIYKYFINTNSYKKKKKKRHLPGEAAISPPKTVVVVADYKTDRLGSAITVSL